MIYEMRTYIAQPGKAEAMIARFLTQARPVIETLGGRLVAVDDSAREAGEFRYIVQFQDDGARQRCWADFARDPRWQAAKQTSEADGPLLRDSRCRVFHAP